MHTHTHAHTGMTMRGHGEKTAVREPGRGASEDAGLAGTLILDFETPDLWGNTFVLSEPPACRVWYRSPRALTAGGPLCAAGARRALQDVSGIPGLHSRGASSGVPHPHSLPGTAIKHVSSVPPGLEKGAQLRTTVLRLVTQDFLSLFLFTPYFLQNYYPDFFLRPENFC